MKYLIVYGIASLAFVIYIFTPESNLLAASSLLFFFSISLRKKLMEEWENFNS